MKKSSGLGCLGLALAVGLFTASATAQSSAVAGDWQGSLQASGVTLHLVLHLKADANGNLGGTLDSIDQGAKGIPITKTELKSGKLTLELDSIHGRFAGTVNTSRSEIAGEWTQLGTLPLTFQRLDPKTQVAPKPGRPTPFDGDWIGALEIGDQKLHLAIHITNKEDGLHATLDSIDQNASGIPATSATQDASGIRLSFAALNASVRGRIEANPEAMDCTFTQNGVNFPLPLKRMKTGN
jgi:hypothetical protein